MNDAADVPRSTEEITVAKKSGKKSSKKSSGKK
ncbi:MAG: hypothetical protein JWR53_1088, partial [Glaciihabitans sp.]|nr:hypothetical protein [Glaciihabitans sp.]